MKIAIIIDKSESYVSFQKDEIFKSWDIELTNVEKFSRLSEVGEETLFGDAPSASIHCPDISSIKDIVSEFESMIKVQSIEKIEEKLKEGLVITTSVARNSTKKLEKIVQDLGGFVVLSKENAKDKTNPISHLMNELSLNKEVENFLKDYAGDNYDMIIPVVRTISELPQKAQSKITIEDVILRIPQPPGAIAPWEIEKTLMSGNIPDMIEMYRRITDHSHALVVVSILKNKFHTMYKISSTIESNMNDLNNRSTVAHISQQLGIPNNYPTKLAYESSNRLGFSKISECLEIIYKLEGNLKGGSSVDANTLVELELMRISRILSS